MTVADNENAFLELEVALLMPPPTRRRHGSRPRQLRGHVPPMCPRATDFADGAEHVDIIEGTPAKAERIIAGRETPMPDFENEQNRTGDIAEVITKIFG